MCRGFPPNDFAEISGEREARLNDFDAANRVCLDGYT